MTEEEFMVEVQALFDAGEYAKIIETWGKDTSNSSEFKAAAFDGFIPRPNDVLVSTYPKSGTTWALQMAYEIGYLGEGDYEHSYDVFSWPDNLIPLKNNPPLSDLSYLADSPTGLRVIKTHLEAPFVPVAAGGKHISVIRDPKDIIVSMVHFENGFNEILFGGSIPVQAFVDAFQTDKFIYQSWPMFIDSWWSLRERDNVLILTYEEMKADLPSTVQKTADFLEVELNEAQLAKVVEKSSYAWMKANDHKYAQPAFGNAEQVPLVRSGHSGTAKELLSAEQQATIDAFCMRELDRLGSTFPYQEMYRC